MIVKLPLTSSALLTQYESPQLEFKLQTYFKLVEVSQATQMQIKKMIQK
ncbi:unnamed protein product [Paramecium sonneborni]|uniref:Uncharacterized protein n=1 Tax=Paramecium sonneborni TaxID=65129 RepID=A0A8S1QA61_9CILI|nr:unnamed protein product [Paramecium sonneborni]